MDFVHGESNIYLADFDFDAVKRVNRLKNQVRCSSWSKIRYLLHINGRRGPFVRLSSRIRLCSLRLSSRQLYFPVFNILQNF